MKIKRVGKGKYWVAVYDTAPAVATAFDGFLYNKPEFLQLQSAQKQLHFYLLNQENTATARIVFFVDSGKVYSPARAPFGGVEVAAGTTFVLLVEFLEAVQQQLAAQNISQIRINQYAFAYAASLSQVITEALVRTGFFISSTSLTHVIPVTENAYAVQIALDENRRLRNAQAAGLVVKQLEQNMLEQVYKFVDFCRKEKNYKLSLDFEQLAAQVKLFPEKYLLFGVYDNANLVAATIAVKVNQEVIYNFYPASLIKYNSLSPLLLINQALYYYCQENRYKFIDLGISEFQGKTIPGLQKFKENCGGVGSLKLSFTRNML